MWKLFFILFAIFNTEIDCEIQLTTNQQNFLNENCGDLQHLNKVNGNYLKSICRVSREMNFEEAQTACKNLVYENIKMQLYVMKTLEDQEMLFKYKNYKYRSCGGCSFWINGKEENNEWWATTDPKERLYEGIKIVDNGGHCLMINNIREKYENHNWNCQKKMHVLCEFNASSTNTDESENLIENK
ncbi:hypothetical protein PVAND_016303 [Polypedilum vanderplanki]|uniref:C-type lectin domain-containing protein n=1 Tax=Polypedilum vanderplanki TaxID=319348 RepID=A0A9J6BF77_POLVA|nr:hypothetical protein PVAND_016303 [Polypedilum vanderplanki]